MNPNPVSFRPRPWFNPNFESRIYIVPGLVAIIMMTIAALLTTLTVAREWERGTMEQLISTPVRPVELILGKFIPYFGIGFFDLILSIVMARFIFAVPVAGSVWLLIALSCIFMAGALATGILISVVAKNQRLASQFAILLTFMPTLMLSGFAYPIWNMPNAVQAITYLVPARYYIVILRGIYLKGIGIKDLWPHGLLLTLYGGLMVFLAVRRFKKKIA
jgi:ABC-2 type transport system permease protein